MLQKHHRVLGKIEKNQIDKIFIINLHCSEKGKSLQYQIPQGAPRQMRLLVL